MLLTLPNGDNGVLTIHANGQRRTMVFIFMKRKGINGTLNVVDELICGCIMNKVYL